MTATFAADYGTFWPFNIRNQPAPLTVVTPASTTSPSTILGEPPEADWKLYALRVLIDQQKRGAYLRLQIVVRFLDWIMELPDALPRPAVAVGEDGSLYVEWDVAGSSLHASFHDDGNEVYFSGDNGDEWEANEVLGLRELTHAIGRISAAM